MFLLFETAAGFALFKVKDGVASSIDTINQKDISKLVSLHAFKKFEDTTEALEACTAIVESKLSKSLKTFLAESIKDKEEELLVADVHLGAPIKSKLGLNVIFNEKLNLELARSIRSNLGELISALAPQDSEHMALGLAHSFSRYKLKFSPDKVDTMIVQAVALLDDLDKEINTYAMRSREWYGWHFPELSKVITDNNVYCKLILAVGVRPNFAEADLSELIPEELETEVKELAPVSMGTEISEEDITNVKELCSQVVEISEYREQLWDYLKSRMQAIAPNLSALVGELVGARLIAHTGSLLNLAKYPASTIQILGAEKALFRALKTKKKTPKYGLIYHASLIGQTPQKNKGQISRVLAAKAALCARVDALGETTEVSIGLEGRSKVEARLCRIEGKPLPPKPTTTPKYDASTAKKTYDETADAVVEKPKKTTEDKPKKKKKAAEEKPKKAAETSEEKPKKKKKAAEEEKKSKKAEASEEKPKKKKKVVEEKKSKKEESSEEEKPKKKKKKAAEEEKPKAKKRAAEETVSEEKPKKKKKKVSKE